MSHITYIYISNYLLRNILYTKMPSDEKKEERDIEKLVWRENTTEQGPVIVLNIRVK